MSAPEEFEPRNAVESYIIHLEEVSTTCDSGWVRSTPRALKATHPPATAGGTDCIQVQLRGVAKDQPIEVGVVSKGVQVVIVLCTHTQVWLQVECFLK